MNVRALSSIFLAILVIFPDVYGFLLGDVARVIVGAIYTEPSLAEPRAAFLAEKLITIVRLSAAAGIILLYSKVMARGARQLLSVDFKVAVSFLYLAIPGLLFATSGIGALDIGSSSVVIVTISFSLIFEILVTVTLVYLLNAVSNGLLLPVLVIFIYDILVLSLATLVSLTGELNYEYYIGLIKSSDFSFLYDWRLVAAMLVHLLAVTITVRIVRDFLLDGSESSSYQNLRKSFVVLGLVALALYLQPSLLFARALALPHSFVASHALEVEGKNSSVVLAGHVPRALVDLAVVDQPASRLSGEIPDDLGPVAREWALFSVPPPPDPPRKRFERIVLVAIESLSLEFTGFKKPPCSTSITPNLDRLMREYPSGALLTNATPSLDSLTSIFVSHPNAREARSRGFPNSFVRRLQSQGFDTLAARPAYEKFDNEHLHYKRAGFDALLGSEFFKSQREYSNYVSGWGLEDAKIYQFAADLLEENRGRNLFFLLTTADTHGPFGRESYSTIYPELPSGISCSLSNERLLRAVFRADHDLWNFVEEIKRRGLLDEKMLLIVTADHSSPPFYEPAPPALAHVPVVFITKNGEVELAGLTDHSSLYDLGPTILSLAGLDPVRGYFGRDLSVSNSSNYFGKHGNKIYWQNAAGKGSIDVDLPMDQRERDIINLTNFFLTSD